MFSRDVLQDGNVECCQIIFDHGNGYGMLYEKTKSDSTPLHSATGTNRADVVRFLVEKSAPQVRLARVTYAYNHVHTTIHLMPRDEREGGSAEAHPHA